MELSFDQIPSESWSLWIFFLFLLMMV